jgi:hypothetical protein
MSLIIKEREKKYRSGYLKGFSYALELVRRKDTLEEMQNYMETVLEPWYERRLDGNVTQEPPPGYRKT